MASALRAAVQFQVPVPGDLSGHPHRALPQLVRVLGLTWHDSTSSQSSLHETRPDSDRAVWGAALY